MYVSDHVLGLLSKWTLQVKLINTSMHLKGLVLLFFFHQQMLVFSILLVEGIELTFFSTLPSKPFKPTLWPPNVSRGVERTTSPTLPFNFYH